MMCSLVLGLESNIIDFKGDLIGVDRGSLFLIEKGFIPKIAIGDFDSCSLKELELIQSKTSVIQLNPEKDDTDTLSALKYAIKSGYDEIYLFNGIGARIDHSFANILLLIKYPEIKMIVSENSKLLIFEKGIYSLKDEYRYISLFSIENSLISLKNFKYDLDNYLLKDDDTLCVSNEFKQNEGIITVYSGKVIVMMVNE